MNFDILQLNDMIVPELLEIAHKLDIKDAKGLEKQELIYKILDTQAMATEWVKYIPKPLPLKNGNKWHVFLSYRSVNRSWALSLYDILAELGYKVFVDQYVIKAGDILIEVLESGLDHSQAAVLIWSNATKDLDWVKKEYYMFEKKTVKDKEFSFVPVVLDKKFQLPLFADNRIFINFSDHPDGPNGGELIRLLYAINNKPLRTTHFALLQSRMKIQRTRQQK